jgi:7-keto-8-aminopelargonate synthetase-like enzyme
MHDDMGSLEETLSDIPESARKLIVTDGVFSMSGDIANLPEIVRLAKEYGARVMVDDAHGLGVLGEGGRGTADFFGLGDEIDIYMGTFSKSLASLGGYMATTEPVVDYVRHKSRPFIFSASITPASCAVARAALRYIRENPEVVTQLRENATYAREGFIARGIKIRDSISHSEKSFSSPIIPIYTYSLENTLATNKALYDAGVYVNPVLPPAAPAGECLLRTSYMATHTKAILDEAMDIVGNVFKERDMLQA